MSTPIFSQAAIRDWDLYSMKTNGLNSLALMEQAAHACVTYCSSLYPAPARVFLACGHGNNGGDGLAMACLLQEAGYEVEVARFPSLKYSDDNSANFERLKQSGVRLMPFPESYDLNRYQLIIDALLGSGINRPAEGIYADWIQVINKAEQPIISIDLPSGMPADGVFDASWPIIKAKHTLCLQQYKWNLHFPESGEFAGQLHCVDIGLNPDFRHIDVHASYLDPKVIASSVAARTTFSHKGSFGHALLVAGSKGMYGAAVLAASACSRSGAGLSSLACPEPLMAPLASSHPEIMSLVSGIAYWTEAIDTQKYTAIGLGPGLGTHDDTAAAMAHFLADTKHALLLDADALNLLAAHRDWLDLLPENTIICPHKAEFDRLFGTQIHWWDRLAKAQEMANTRKLVIVLKNAFTFVLTPGKQPLINRTGNAGLAKAGSGDVLSGIITALRAQGLPASDAAAAGVWIHGRAAELAAREKGLGSMIASDLIAQLGKVFLELEKMKSA